MPATEAGSCRAPPLPERSITASSGRCRDASEMDVSRSQLAVPQQSKAAKNSTRDNIKLNNCGPFFASVDGKPGANTESR